MGGPCEYRAKGNKSDGKGQELTIRFHSYVDLKQKGMTKQADNKLTDTGHRMVVTSGERAGGGQESEGGQLHGVGRKLDFGVQMSGCNVHPTFTCCY